jgi:hypothetical protein
VNRKYDITTYSFLPDGWYFEESLHSRNECLDLYTASDTWIARENYYERSSDRKISIYEGLGQERGYIESLFKQKSNFDRAARDAINARYEIEKKATATRTMEQLQKDFAKINKTIRAEPSDPCSLDDFDKRLTEFKNKLLTNKEH